MDGSASVGGTVIRNVTINDLNAGVSGNVNTAAIDRRVFNNGTALQHNGTIFDLDTAAICCVPARDRAILNGNVSVFCVNCDNTSVVSSRQFVLVHIEDQTLVHGYRHVRQILAQDNGLPRQRLAQRRIQLSIISAFPIRSRDIGGILTGLGAGLLSSHILEHAGVQGDRGILGHIFAGNFALSAVSGQAGGAHVDRAEVRHLEVDRFLVNDLTSGVTAGIVVIPYGVIALRQRQVQVRLVHGDQPDLLVGRSQRGLHRNGTLGSKTRVNAAEPSGAVVRQHIRKRRGRRIIGQGFRLGVVGVHLKVCHRGRVILHGDLESLRLHQEIASIFPVDVRYTVRPCLGKLERHLVRILTLLTGGKHHPVVQIPVSGMVCPRVGRSFSARQRYLISDFDAD